MGTLKRSPKHSGGRGEVAALSASAAVTLLTKRITPVLERVVLEELGSLEKRIDEQFGCITEVNNSCI